jgi:hypothetical protein
MTDMPLGAGYAPGLTSRPAGPPDEILAAFAEPAHQNRLTVLVFTDRYLPFELGAADYPVQLELRPGPLNRLAVFFRLILAIPAHLVTMLVILGMETIVMFITWLIVLIAGRMPRALYEAIAAGLRYYIRFTGYLFLVTATYPWGLFGDEAARPEEGTGWLGGNEPWRLVLSSGAKGLVGMFLAIGVLVAALYGVLTGVAGSSGNNTSPATAAQAMDTAYAPLSSTAGSYQADLAACGNNLSCAHGVDSRMSQAFAPDATHPGWPSP